jgi:hypothetical protein
MMFKNEKQKDQFVLAFAVVWIVANLLGYILFNTWSLPNVVMVVILAVIVYIDHKQRQ